MTAFFVDIQFYLIDESYILKEASILSLDGTVSRHFVFYTNHRLDQLRSEDQKTANYIIEKLKVIHLHCGNDSISSFLRFIPSNAILLVNGFLKKKILKEYLPHQRIIDIRIPFRVMRAKERCDFPYYHTQCSFTNVHKLRNYLFTLPPE